VVSVDVIHHGEAVKLQRDQDRDNEISSFYVKTTRGKIQKMHPFAPHAVETVGELDVIEYAKQRSAGDDTILIIDTRTPNWPVISGGIPTAINIPYTRFKNKEKALEIMEDQLGVQADDVYDFSYAKTLVMYCNGIWCGQTPAAINALLKYGYPAAKIKYYRGGMNAWKSLGLTTVNL
jgi:rhodanese-related sulfurtransferase